MNDNFCPVLLNKLLYNDIWYHIHDLKYTNNILPQFVILYETRFSQHSYFWYYRPFIIDLLTLIKNNIYLHQKQAYLLNTN